MQGRALLLFYITPMHQTTPLTHGEELQGNGLQVTLSQGDATVVAASPLPSVRSGSGQLAQRVLAAQHLQQRGEAGVRQARGLGERVLQAQPQRRQHPRPHLGRQKRRRAAAEGGTRVFAGCCCCCERVRGHWACSVDGGQWWGRVGLGYQLPQAGLGAVQAEGQRDEGVIPILHVLRGLHTGASGRDARSAV